MLWVIIVLLVVDAVVIELLNYAWNGWRWYMPCIFLFCNGLTILWVWAMHIMQGNKNLIYRFSILWEITFILVATGFPFLLGVKPNAKLLIGATLAVIAIYLCKSASE
jgi:hypothetical protein